MLLRTFVKRLDNFASCSLAGSWDNVGLLVEPTSPHLVRLALCAIDLTEDVMKEAIGKRVDAIISYHPPIFSPLKRVTQDHWKQRIIVKALENRIAIYSPHTSLDSVKGGVNDWLLNCFEQEYSTPLQTFFGSLSGKGGKQFSVTMRLDGKDDRLAHLQNLLKNFNDGMDFQTNVTENGVKFTIKIPADLKIFTKLLEQVGDINKDNLNIDVVKQEALPHIGIGEGRKIKLKTPIKISDVIKTIKKHLCIDGIRVALAPGQFQHSEVLTIAACAGSGGSILKGIESDVYLSGEMSHHDILEANANGVSVILCEHSNTERGYLTVFAEKVKQLCNNEVDVILSLTDRDPLQIV